MAIDRLFLSIKQDLIAKASDLSEESTRLLREGNVPEAQAKLGEVSLEFAKVKTIDDLVPDIIKVLEKAGIQQPTEEYLTTIVKEKLQIGTAVQAPEDTAREITDQTEKENPVINKDERSIEFEGKRIKFGKVQFAVIELLATNFDNWFESSGIIAHLENAGEAPANLGQNIYFIRKKLKDSGDDIHLHSKWVGKKVAQYKLSYDEIEARTKTPKRKKSAGERTPKTPKEKKGIARDFSEREEKVATALFVINEDRDNFQNEDLRQVVQNAYADMLEPLIVDDKRKKTYSLITTGRYVREHIFEKLRKFESQSKVPNRINNFFDWLKSQPEYEGLNVDQLAQVAERVLSFSDIKVRNFQEPLSADRKDTRETEEIPEGSNKLSKKELGILASVIIGNNRGGKLNIQHPDDKKKIVLIGEQMSASSYEAGEIVLIEERLTKKFKAFVGDKTAVFRENMESEEAQYLLAFLAGLETPGQIEELIPKQI